MQVAMAKTGRKRKSGQRYASGDLKKPWKPRRVDWLYPLAGECEAIYVLEAGHGVVKIGHSIDPRHRVGQLQVGQHVPLTLNWYVWLQKADAIAIEAAFHKAMRRTARHAMGELYYLGSEDAVKIINTLIFRRNCWAFEETWFDRPWERFQAVELRR
jgi:hypothetical protein